MDNNARHNRRSPSEFGAEQHLCKRPSALAVGAIGKKTHATLFISQQSTSQRNQRVNDIGHMVYSSRKRKHKWSTKVIFINKRTGLTFLFRSWASNQVGRGGARIPYPNYLPTRKCIPRQ